MLTICGVDAPSRQSATARHKVAWVADQFEKFAPVLELCRSVERIAKTKSELERSDQPYTQAPKHLKKSAVSNEDYQR